MGGEIGIVAINASDRLIGIRLAGQQCPVDPHQGDAPSLTDIDGVVEQLEIIEIYVGDDDPGEAAVEIVETAADGEGPLPIEPGPARLSNEIIIGYGIFVNSKTVAIGD